MKPIVEDHCPFCGFRFREIEIDSPIPSDIVSVLEGPTPRCRCFPPQQSTEGVTVHLLRRGDVRTVAVEVPSGITHDNLRKSLFHVFDWRDYLERHAGSSDGPESFESIREVLLGLHERDGVPYDGLAKWINGGLGRLLEGYRRWWWDSCDQMKTVLDESRGSPEAITPTLLVDLLNDPRSAGRGRAVERLMAAGVTKCQEEVYEALKRLEQGKKAFPAGPCSTEVMRYTLKNWKKGPRRRKLLTWWGSEGPVKPPEQESL